MRQKRALWVCISGVAVLGFEVMIIVDSAQMSETCVR